MRPEEEEGIPAEGTVERPAWWMTESGLSLGHRGIGHFPIQTQFNVTGWCRGGRELADLLCLLAQHPTPPNPADC